MRRSEREVTHRRSGRGWAGAVLLPALGVLVACTSTVAGTALPGPDVVASTRKSTAPAPPTTAAPSSTSAGSVGTTNNTPPTTPPTENSPSASQTSAAATNFGVNLDYDFLDDEDKAGIVEFARLLVERSGDGIGAQCSAFNTAALNRTWADAGNRAQALDLLRSSKALSENDNGVLTWTNAGLDESLIGNYEGLPAPCFLLLSAPQSEQDPIGCADAYDAGKVLDDTEVDERWTYCFTGGYLAVGGLKAGTPDGADSVALMRESADGTLKTVLPATKSFDAGKLEKLTLPSDASAFLLESKRWKSLNDNIG
ncbi:hypothetical protein D1871_20455 [Nakamurella silvestris]|nr:hypothetical protein D1871_20455 [Nakamurella silvestris]